jgi:hypothetical protein
LQDYGVDDIPTAQPELTEVPTVGNCKSVAPQVQLCL